jgi:hypothetical protein
MKTEDFCHYFQSPHWRDTVERALAKAEHRCTRRFLGPAMKHDVRCPSTGSLQVHLRRTDRLDEGRDEDIEVLCAVCHALAHVQVPACEFCGEGVLDMDEDIRAYIEDAMWRDPDFTLDGLDWGWLHHYPYCQHCEYMLSKDD